MVIADKRSKPQKNVYVANALSVAHTDIHRSLSKLDKGATEEAKNLALSALKKIAEAIACL